jgi:hypothetical protein
MPDPQGLCEYGGYTTLIGGDYTTSRGVQPGVFRLRMACEPTLAKFTGPLTLRYGTDSWTYQGCINGPHIQRVYKGRQPYCWSVKVYDKRWKWRYPRISGHYNVRNCGGQIDESNKKSLLELILILLEALGETNSTTRDIPDVYPEVHWDQAYAARYLEWLCDWAGLVICPQPDGVILIEAMGSGASLPVRNDNISPTYTYRQTVMPSQVDMRTGPSRYQSLINLQAVSLDPDGTIVQLNNSAIKPAAGWASQWYTTFSDVTPVYRHLAFQTVWRWYRLHSQDSATGGASLETMKSLKILERLAETHPDDLGVGRCLEAVIKGIFWQNSDHKANNDIPLRYSGPFRVIPDLQLIAFDHPVIKWTNGLPDAADLKLYVAYNAVGPTGEYINEVFSQQVTESITATSPRVEKRQYLSRVRNFDSPYGVSQGQADNLSEVQAESTAYLSSIVNTYAGGPEKDMLYGGLIPIGLSGKIAQVGYRWGNGRVATTRASENHEFDTSQNSHQLRRRWERLGQIWDKWMESQ